MTLEHQYKITTIWQGNKEEGTNNVRTYDRSHTIYNNGKPDLYLTTDKASVGDKSKLNPEDLLVSAISSCHMLSYLYLCALEGIIVTEYIDQATGIMIENTNGGGQFKTVTLNPNIKVKKEDMIPKAIELHHKAHEICYIANSVNFEVICNPTCSI
jgi:organic hydroperoxide reductase OsmC/OhrA